jgi:hypothetical protein
MKSSYGLGAYPSILAYPYIILRDLKTISKRGLNMLIQKNEEDELFEED